MPAHAQSSAVLVYFSDRLIQSGQGPSVIRVTIQGDTAHVETLNGSGNVIRTTDLPLNGDWHEASHYVNCDGEEDKNGSQLRVLNYSLGDPDITIDNGNEVETAWRVTVPRGDGSMPEITCDD